MAKRQVSYNSKLIWRATYTVQNSMAFGRMPVICWMALNRTGFEVAKRKEKKVEEEEEGKSRKDRKRVR